MGFIKRVLFFVNPNAIDLRESAPPPLLALNLLGDGVQ